MGGGSWTRDSYASYSKMRGRSVDSSGRLSGDYSLQDMYSQRHIHPDLNPHKVMRECCDTEEHPNTIPVIIGLDVTGSMGPAGIEVAKAIGGIMETLYEKYKDIEFMVMGIGDLSCDDAPIQISQFESDVRIAEHLDKVYFERGGGGNSYESYTAAWYMGLNHCKLDCWNRGKKGIIITTGDEPMNPYLPKRRLENVAGDSLQADVETPELYAAASEKFNIYHIAVSDKSSYRNYAERIANSFGQLLGDRLKVSTVNGLSENIVACIDDALASDGMTESFVASVKSGDNASAVQEDGTIGW